MSTLQQQQKEKEEEEEELIKISNCCLKGSIISGIPIGFMTNLNLIEEEEEEEDNNNNNKKEIKYYLTGKEFEGNSNGKVIVLACDIFGLGVNNPKLIGDALAKSIKMPVYIPDLLEGDHPSPEGLTLMETPIGHLSFLTRTIKLAKVFGGFITKIGPLFLYKHRPGIMVPLTDKFCNALRTQKGATRIGMIGYCMGGTITTKLASLNFNSVDVLVTAHPGQLNLNDFKMINKPYALICSQEDFAFDSIKKEALIILEEKKSSGIPIAIYEHPGTTHGFAARPNLNEPLIKIAFEKALEQTKDWFVEHL